MVDLSQIEGIRQYVSEFSSLESDYIFTHLTSDHTDSPIVSGPLRVNGMVFCFVVSGYMNVDINLDSYSVGPETIVTASSTNIITIRDVDTNNFDAYVLIISPEFMRDINIDINVLKSTPFTANRKPCFKLVEGEADLLLQYLRLFHLNTKKNQDDLYIRSISRSLLAALIYQMLQFVSLRTTAQEPSERSAISRRTSYVRDFMDLVHTHHKKERSVSFYADKLFITPKYLSLIIKEATGRSAAEWIDDFVILEAKNMLRFSRKNIQQIAYELNFSNQSSFGKYFKNLTGMSPSAYQHTS